MRPLPRRSPGSSRSPSEGRGAARRVALYLYTALSPGSDAGWDVGLERRMGKHCLTLGGLDRERIADIDRKLALKLDGSQMARTKRSVDIRTLPTPAVMAVTIDAVVTQQPGSKTYRAMTVVADDAGLRPSEVVMLRVRSVDLPTEGWGRLDVTEADISFDEPGEPKTGPRTVPIPPVLVNILREWIKDNGLTTMERLLFRTRHGTMPNGSNWARAWDRALESVGQNPMRVYDCRHAAATTWLRAGMPPGETARRLGHSVETPRVHLRRRPRRRRTHCQPEDQHLPRGASSDNERPAQQAATVTKWNPTAVTFATVGVIVTAPGRAVERLRTRATGLLAARYFLLGTLLDNQPCPRGLSSCRPLLGAARSAHTLHDVRRRLLMADPIEDIIGDYRAFAAQQRDRLATLGIDITPYGLSHLAYRVPEWDQYVHVRGLLERHAITNSENVWNGRPISLIVPAESLEVLDDKVVPLIELIAPVHQRVYKMGLEHLGVVVGDTFDVFIEAHKPVLTGQQFQGPNSTPDPVYILFEDFTHVKFYRLSLKASVEHDAGPFKAGFHHVEDWVPQRLTTATGPNRPPR
ncbi:MAG: VOC family protein [Ilumatobacteraceae bacterium]